MWIDDVWMTQNLIKNRLSPNTNPTENKARAAARRMLEATQALLQENCRDNLQTADLIVFLHGLATMFDPVSVLETEKPYFARKVVFKYASQGTKKARQARAEHVDIALEVYLLNAADKKGTSLTAKKRGMDSSQVSHICGEPAVEQEVASWRRSGHTRAGVENFMRVPPIRTPPGVRVNFDPAGEIQKAKAKEKEVEERETRRKRSKGKR